MKTQNHFKGIRHRHLMTTAVALAWWGAPAAVQAAEPDRIEEVIVTAQKRAENLQTVPISVTAFTGETLRANQVNSVYDLARYTPNVQFSEAGTASSSGGTFYIRGIGQFLTHFTADPAVGVYFDDVYMARATGSNFDLGDIAQVEVLKGPQGTLFGRNTISGAVSVRTNKPDFNPGGTAEVTVGNVDQMLARATVNAPITDGKLAARFSVLGIVRDGWGKNIAGDGRVYDMGRTRTIGGRAQLLWTASDEFEVLLAGDFNHARGTGTPGGLTHFTPSATSIAFNATSPVKVGPQWIVQGYTSYLFLKPEDDFDTAGGSVTMTWEPGDVTIKSISAYRDQSNLTTQDYGGVPVSWIAQRMTQNQWQVSQELQATGDAAADRLHYTMGAYYFKESADNDTYAALFGSDLFIPASTVAESLSGYGQLTFDMTDKFSLTGGGRYTHEKKRLTVQTVLAGGVILPRSTNRTNFNAFTPMGNLKYQWSDDVMTYLSISKGFRSGAYNAQPFSVNDLVPTRPEKSITYEAGAKITSADDRVRFNVSGFYTDYTDIQLGATTRVNGVFIYRNANAAKATIYGGEAELSAVLGEGLEAYLNGSYLHSSLAAVPGFSFGVSKLPMAPKFIVDAGLKYSFEASGYGQVTASADTNWRSGAYPQFNPSPESRQHSYALVNARVTFEPKDAAWSFTLWTKNLTDKKYEVFGQTAGSGDVTVGWFGRPREIGATAALSF